MSLYKHFLFLQQTKLFMKLSNRQQRGKITSRKATAPFLVGSVILQTWNIHIRDLLFQKDGLHIRATTVNILYITDRELEDSLDTISYRDFWRSGSAWLPSPLTLKFHLSIHCRLLNPLPDAPLHLRAAKDCSDFKSHHRSPSIEGPDSWLLWT